MVLYDFDDLMYLELKISFPRKDNDKWFNYGMQANIVKLEHPIDSLKTENMA